MNRRRLSIRNTARAGARVAAALAATTALLALGGIATAQEGHPLKGSWIGEWEGNAHGESVLLVLNYRDDTISGIINPGTQDIEITDAELDPSDWSLRIEAEGDIDGESVSYVIEGHIEDLELPSRTLVGTWRGDGGRGAFEVQRQ